MKTTHRTGFFAIAGIVSAFALIIIIPDLGCRRADKQEDDENSTVWLDLPETEKHPDEFEPFLQQHPEDRDHRDAALVWYSRREKDNSQLKQHTFELIKHHPDSMHVYFANVSLFYQEPDYRDEVIAALEKQIERGHTGHDIYWNLAHACEQGALPRTFKDEDNRKRFLRYFELPEDTQLPTELDERLANKAIRYYRLAIESAPEDYRSLYADGLMRLLVRLEKPRESVEIARDMLKTSSDVKKDANFLSTFGRALKEMGHIEEAEKVLRQVRPIDKEGFGGEPGHATTDAEMLLGEVALDRGDMKAAAKHLLASVDVQRCCHNTTQGISLGLAERLLEAGEFGAVVKFCEKALDNFVSGQPETEHLLSRARTRIAAQTPPSSIPAEKPDTTDAYIRAIIDGDLVKVRQMLVAEPSLISARDKGGKGGSGLPALHMALRHGHADIVRFLLSQGADPNSECAGPWAIGPRPALYYAKTRQAAEILIANGADVYWKDNNDSTLLHALPEWGNTETAEAVLAHGADVNVNNKFGKTPLHRAVEAGRFNLGAATGQTKMIALLLANGAKVNVRDKSGSTPLHRAASQGHREAIERLFAHGADINARDRAGRTPLNYATEGGWWPQVVEQKVAELLLARGADYTISDVAWTGDVDRVRELLKNDPALANATDPSHRESVLYAAIRRGHADIVDILLAHGAKINVTDRYGNSPLLAAACVGHRDIAQRLLDSGTDVNEKGMNGELALHLAAARCHTDVVALLLDVGSDVNVRADNQRLYNDGVCSDKDIDVVKQQLWYLGMHRSEARVQLMEPIRLAFAIGDTALHSATKRGCTEIVTLLLASGADTNAVNEWGETPLHYAIVFDQKEIIASLLNAGADVNAKMPNSSTPLDLAFETAPAGDIVSLLVTNGGVRSEADGNSQKQ